MFSLFNTKIDSDVNNGAVEDNSYGGFSSRWNYESANAKHKKSAVVLLVILCFFIVGAVLLVGVFAVRFLRGEDRLLYKNDISRNAVSKSVSVQNAQMLNFSFEELSESQSELYKLPKGLQVVYVDSMGNASKAGLAEGDIIVACNSKKVSSVRTLDRCLNACAKGDKITLTVFRNSNYLDIDFDY